MINVKSPICLRESSKSVQGYGCMIFVKIDYSIKRFLSDLIMLCSLMEPLIIKITGYGYDVSV